MSPRLPSQASRAWGSWEFPAVGTLPSALCPVLQASPVPRPVRSAPEMGTAHGFVQMRLHRPEGAGQRGQCLPTPQPPGDLQDRVILPPPQRFEAWWLHEVTAFGSEPNVPQRQPQGSISSRPLCMAWGSGHPVLSTRPLPEPSCSQPTAALPRRTWGGLWPSLSRSLWPGPWRPEL